MLSSSGAGGLVVTVQPSYSAGCGSRIRRSGGIRRKNMPPVIIILIIISTMLIIIIIIMIIYIYIY